MGNRGFYGFSYLDQNQRINDLYFRYLAGISGLKMWLHASNLNEKDGDQVSFWPDRSGNENHATLITATGATKVDGIFSGWPALQFSEAQAYHINRGLFISTNLSIFVAGMITNPKNDNHFIGGTTNLLNQNFIFGWKSTAMATLAYSSNDINLSFNTTGRPEVLSATQHSAGRRIWLNYSMSAIDTNTTLPTGVTGSAIGRYLTNFFRGYIAEILLFIPDIDEGNRLAVMAYLSNKYGIAN